MDTVERSLECGVMLALEERIWLDRREDACTFFPARRAGWEKFRAWLRNFAARTQMGPVPDGEVWLDRHREDRF